MKGILKYKNCIIDLRFVNVILELTDAVKLSMTNFDFYLDNYKLNEVLNIIKEAEHRINYDSSALPFIEVPEKSCD